MANDINVLLQASVNVFGFAAHVDIQLVGGPVFIRLSPEHPVSFPVVWEGLSNALDEIAGFPLPDLGAWNGLITAPTWMEPSLYLGPSGSNEKGLSVQIELAFLEPVRIGGSIPLGGGVTVSITPNFSVHALYLGYDEGAGGLSLRARVSTATSAAGGSPGTPKTQILSYPFPVPAQDSAGTFQLHYLGVGQRVGPTVQVTADDPMAAIFDQLENELTGDDPTTLLTTLAKRFYQPDRGWFIAADLEMKGFRIRVLFNDPVLYGLEISVAANPPTPFAGLLFEILYQKLSPNLGLYYGALTLPTLMRRIVLEGVILILPGFQIWVYTNGDFRVNVGWPLGSNSIGIQVAALVGGAGFYFAKLRSSDNPGAQANADYTPILAFGMGVGLFVNESFNASIFSAQIAVSLSATFQGLLAWRAGHDVSGTPDHYWFAATASLSVLIQGTVDFSVIKASVTISFTANIGVAFETGYATLIAVSAAVRVEVSVKIVFFTIHLSFSTSISRQWTIGVAPFASVNGPLAPGLAIVGNQSPDASRHADLLETADRLIARLRARRREPAGWTAGSARPHWRLEAASWSAAARRVPILLQFVLQPAVVYDTPNPFNLVASLVTDCPAPNQPCDSPRDRSSFEQLIVTMIDWLLAMAPPGPLSSQFRFLVDELGSGSEPPLGSWAIFSEQLAAFVQNAFTFTLRGTDLCAAAEEQAVALVPMFDALQMQWTGVDGTPQTIDFSTWQAAPNNYPLAINLYYEAVAWTGAAPVESATRLLQRSPQSMASFVFVDYFVLQARHAVGALLQAALDDEAAARQALMMHLDRASGGAGSFALVGDYVVRVTGGDALDDLLAQFDYASAAGLGSRLQMGGLQLPVPSQVPAQPTPQNMSSVPTAPLFELTGQQIVVAAGQTARVTLALNPAYGAPAGWINFEGSPDDSASATFPVPALVPPAPSARWEGVSSPVTTGYGTIDVTALAPVSPHPLYVALKSQIAWSSPGGAKTLLPLPSAITGLLSIRQLLRLQVAPEAPPASNPAAAPGSPTTPLPTAPALLIRLSLTQVPVANPTVSQGGSPIHAAGSPPQSGVSTSYLPYVYQLSGADEMTRDLIYAALLTDLSQARISLLRASTETRSPQVPTAILLSSALSPEVLATKTNLSTLNQIVRMGRQFALSADAIAATQTDSAALTDVPGFLRLLWEVSVVNAPGFFLFYLTAQGEDLPGSLFSDTGTPGGMAAELDVLVELAPRAELSTLLPAFANTLVLDEGDVTQALFAQVFDAADQVVPTWAPTYPAGYVGLSVDWDHPVSSPDDPIPVQDQYHLLQYRVASEGAYAGSVWSLPVGPTKDNQPLLLRRANAPAWSYVQTVPAYLFIGADASPPPNRYAVIGQPISLQLRVVDLYGNVLPGSHTAVQRPRYQDPLIAILEWPGVSVRYQVRPGSGSTVSLVLGLQFDPTAIVPPQHSSMFGASPRQTWSTTLGRYLLILDQLNDPNTSIRLTSTLTDVPLGDADGLVAFAALVAASIADALSAAAPPDDPVVPPASQPLRFVLTHDAARAIADNIFPVRVAVELQRPAELVDPDALVNLPSVASINTLIAPELGAPDGSPQTQGSLTAFAVPFEQAYQNFDGHGGCLKLAQRAAVHTGVNVDEVSSLWAMRWSESNGYHVTLGDELAFFALQPLSTTPISHSVGLQTWSGVDLDEWAREFLTAFDSFLSPELAAAIGILDLRYSTRQYERLVATKQLLAQTIPLGIAPLFTDQTQGSLQDARAQFEQSLLTALGSAYVATTVIQVPAQVNALGSPNAFSPDVAPRLSGSLGVSGDSPRVKSQGGTAPYTLSTGELTLTAGNGWMTALLSVAQPGAQAELALDLSYQAAYLQHDFQPGEAYAGYVPSSWLKFALPDAAPLQMSLQSPAGSPERRSLLPIPLVSQPAVPAWVQQGAVAAALASPEASSIGDEIARALRWMYSVEVGLDLARGADQLYVDVTYNRRDTAHAGLDAAPDRRLPLFEALAAFRDWYATSAAQFAQIPAAAFPNRAPPSGDSPPDSATLINEFAILADSVANAWAACLSPPDDDLLVTQDGEITDRYRIALDSFSDTTMHLWATTDANGALPRYLPSIGTRDGQSWQPVAPSPGGASQTWVKFSHNFCAGVKFDRLTMEFGPIDIMERQSATSSAWVQRNANLLPGRMTNEAFVYSTQTAAFANSVIPLIHREAFPLVLPGDSLLDTLAQILGPIEQAGAGFAPRLRLSASYAYARAPTLLASSAMRMVDHADFEISPSTFLARTEEALAGWVRSREPSTSGAVLRLAITLFGNLQGQELPLVQFDQISISVAGLPMSWWQGSPT